MVGVGVGGDRPFDRTAGIDEKTTSFAIEPFGGGHQEVSWDGSGRGHRSEPILEPMEQQHARYWRRVLRLTGVLLGVWFVAGLGAGVLFKEQLDAITIPGTGFPLGFWMAQQGSILVSSDHLGVRPKDAMLDRDAGWRRTTNDRAGVDRDLCRTDFWFVHRHRVVDSRLQYS